MNYPLKFFSFNAKKWIFCFIDPKKFLELTPPVNRYAPVLMDKVQGIKKSMLSGKKFLPLDLYVFEGEIVGHEGRHRSYSSMELGIKLVPVRLRIEDDGYVTYKTGRPYPLDVNYDKMRTIESYIGKDAMLEVISRYQKTYLNVPKHFKRINSKGEALSKKDKSIYLKGRLRSQFDRSGTKPQKMVNFTVKIANYSKLLT